MHIKFQNQAAKLCSSISDSEAQIMLSERMRRLTW